MKLPHRFGIFDNLPILYNKYFELSRNIPVVILLFSEK